MKATLPQEMPPPKPASPFSLRSNLGNARGALSRPTINAAAWATSGYVVGQIIRLTSNIVLARLLFPSAFGIMALVNTVLTGLAMFSDVGIRPSIIQNRRGDDPVFLNTAWTIQVGRGMLLFLACCLLSVPLAAFYGEPLFASLLPVAGAAALLAGFNSTALATASRHLRIGLLTGLEIGTALLGATVMCVWAWLAPSVWALLGGSLVSSAFILACSHTIFAGPRNRLAWDAAARHDLFHFGKWIFLSTITTFCATQADRLMLGKLIPIGELGIYSVGLAIALIPSALISTLCHGVLFSLLTKQLRESRVMFWRRLHGARDMLLPIAMFLVLVVGFESPHFFHLCYDARYAPAGWITVYLTGWIWLRVLSATLDRALPALADTRGGAIFELVRAIASLLLSLVGFQLAGLPGFIAGLTLGAACGHAVIHWLLSKHRVYPLGQDLKYTVVLILVGLFIQAASLLGDRLIPHGRFIVPPLILAAVGLWTAARVLRQLKREPQGGPALADSATDEE